MNISSIQERIVASHPGWDEWNELLKFVASCEFELVNTDYMGNFYAHGSRLTFSALADQPTWPDWLPDYVPALYGMKACHWEMAGGYADMFTAEPAQRRFLFSYAGNDDQLGYPLFDPPSDTFPFQSNSSGATFFVNKDLDILYPNSEMECLETLDTLEDFTRKNIHQALAGKFWSDAYHGLQGNLLG